MALVIDLRRVMKDPVEDGRGDHWVAEDLVLLTKGVV